VLAVLIHNVRALAGDRHGYKFCGRAFANSCKSGEPISHEEQLHIKNLSFLTDDLKNLKSVVLPWFEPNL
jgi:hypothetical protein